MKEFIKNKQHFFFLVMLIMVYLFFASASIFRITEYWEISNELFWARDLAVATAITTVLSLVVSRYSFKLGVAIFLMTFFMEIFGNVFYSYHWLVENSGQSKYFSYWCELNSWIYAILVEPPQNNMTEYEKTMKIFTVWLQGSFAPIMQTITFFSIQKVMGAKPDTQIKDSIVSKEIMPVEDSTVEEDNGLQIPEPDIITPTIPPVVEETTAPDTQPDMVEQSDLPDIEPPSKEVKEADPVPVPETLPPLDSSTPKPSITGLVNKKPIKKLPIQQKPEKWILKAKK